MNTDRIEGAARDVGGKVQGLVGRVTGSNQTHAEGFANEVAGTAQNLYGQAVDGAREAADYAERAYERGTRYVRGTSRSLEKQVGEHPWTGALIAGAIGFALGVVAMANRG